MRTTFNFHSAGEVVFGSGGVQQLGARVRERRLQRVLVVTDRALAAAGALEAVLDPLRKADRTTHVFQDGEPEPSFAVAERCVADVKDFVPDCVVGLGGGSNMDLAKMTATLLAHGGPPGRFVGDCIVPGPLVPLVCIPTTAGTGSEVTASAVLTDTERKLKVGVLSEYMRPALAIVDPLLTLSCPPKVTADSGIDALTHAIEAYTAVENSHFPLPAGERSVYQGRNPIGDLFAEQAIILAGKHLRRAVDEPKNLEAREGMALAATMAGLAFSNVGVALVHAMEYPVGGAVHVSHGAGNGLLLPFVMEFNLPERTQRMARVAELLGENVAGLTTKAAAERAIAAVRALSSAIGIPQRLSAIGVVADQLPAFAEKAITIKRIIRVNPRIPTQEDILNIYRAAL